MNDLQRNASDEPETSASLLETVLVSVFASGAVGAIAGVIWGGVGGRIAMRIVMLTSNDAVRGVTSDDGFEIGIFSGATVVLLFLAGFLGGIVGSLCGLVRTVLAGPTVVVASGVGVAVGLGAGASIVHTGGVDFQFLDPLWLTIGLFVFLPAAWGVTVVALTDWLLAPGRMLQRPLRRPINPWTASVGWLVFGTVAFFGGLDLIDDIRHLLRSR